MSSLGRAITNTLSYAAYFDYPLALAELHYWLITPKPVSLKSLTKSLTPKLLKQLNTPSTKREQRRLLTQKKLANASHTLKLLKYIPSIKLIAVTGSLAMSNAKKDADIDLMIITKGSTLWITRLIVLLLTTLFSNRRHPNELHQPNTVCLNLWLDEEALLIPKTKQNLYVAHEVLQIKPIYSKDQTYQKFILKNSWTKKYLANAHYSLVSSFGSLPNKRGPVSKSSLLYLINLLAFKLQYLYMRSKITKEYITLHEAYFHPRDLTANINHHLQHD